MTELEIENKKVLVKTEAFIVHMFALYSVKIEFDHQFRLIFRFSLVQNKLLGILIASQSELSQYLSLSKRLTQVNGNNLVVGKMLTWWIWH